LRPLGEARLLQFPPDPIEEAIEERERTWDKLDHHRLINNLRSRINQFVPISGEWALQSTQYGQPIDDGCEDLSDALDTARAM